HAATLQSFEDQLSAILGCGFHAALRCPVGKRASFQAALPGNPRKLHATYVTAAAVIEDVEHSAALDAVAQHGILQAALEGAIAVGARPGWHEDADSGIRGGVWIKIHHDVHTCLTSGVHHREGAHTLAPHRLPHNLVVS